MRRLTDGGRSVYNAKSWDVVKTFSAAHSAQVTGIEWGTDAKFLASSSMDRSLKIWA